MSLGLYEFLVLVTVMFLLGRLWDGPFMALIELETHGSDVDSTGALGNEG